jgi:DNA-binding Lrp family transcriptional regulator
MRSTPDDDETHEGPYDRIWRNLELSPEKVAERVRRREAAGKLFAELANVPPAGQAELLRQARFQNLDLLDLLLESSQEAQPAEASRAEELSHLAARLAAGLAEEEPEAAAALPRAFCLGANARRLLQDVEGADAMLARAAPFVEFPGERALYCRVAALVRWEQGRADEADALLRHGARLFGEEGLAGEEACSRGLLGLLQMEQTGMGDPLPALLDGWSEMGREVRPALALRVGLAAAVSLAERGQADRARSTLREAWRLFAEIQGSRELLRASWLEARVLGRLGEREEALQILESVRLRLFLEPSPAEAALVSIDLGLVLAESGRAAEIESLAKALRKSFPDEAPLIVATGGLLHFAELALEAEPGLRSLARHAMATMTRTFRVARLSLRPLPFA